MVRTIESTTRGGRGRGGDGDRGRGRGGGSVDHRFARRHVDPRFAPVQRPSHHHRSNVAAAASAAADPRFANRLGSFAGRRSEDDDDEEEEDEKEEEEEEDEEEVEMSEEVEEEEGEEAGEEDEDPAWSGSDIDLSDATRRIAVVKCDWDHVRAVDLFAIFTHSLPLGGKLLDVAVYKSRLGQEQLELERVHGPDLWEKNPQKGDSSTAVTLGEHQGGEEVVAEDEEGDAAGDDEDADDGWYDDDVAMLDEEGENGEKFSSGKYRAYELRRMKYFYAIATFDSADTAAEVYNLVDGVDIEASGVMLDLRYVDDDETFDDAPLVQRCTKLPAHFKPLRAFKAAALSQSKFRISWDQDDFARVQDIRDSFEDDTDEANLAAYLAPTGDSDDETAGDRAGTMEAKRRRIRQKYATLFDEIGGLDVDAAPAGLGETNSDDGSRNEESEEEDDDLNRFSDVELDEDDTGDETGEEDGDKEATIDFDAEDKARNLQKRMRLDQQLRDGTLGERQQLKYKERRKAVRRAKKDGLGDAAVSEEDDEETKGRRAAQLRTALEGYRGHEDEGTGMKKGGKQRRKEHAKEVRARVAEERAAKKRQRVAAQFNLTTNDLKSKSSTADAGKNIDDRFGARLLQDPRFHLDVQSDRRLRKNTELVKLASSVNETRIAKKKRPTTNPTESNTDDPVGYFLEKKRTRR